VLTTLTTVGIDTNMKAGLLIRERHQLKDDAFVELKVWRVPQMVRGSAHSYKYSLACIVAGVCVVRYDNEAGKGDHRHVGEMEMPYRFSTVDRLISDFWRDVDGWV
jgi:hypothetical protein